MSLPRGSWAVLRLEIKDHIFFILEVKETFLTTQVQKGSLEVKKGGYHPIVSNVDYHGPLVWKASWLKDVGVRVGGPQDKPNRLRSRQSKMTGQRKPRRNAPHKWFKPKREKTQLSLSLPMCPSIHTVLFFLLINTLPASLLSVSMWKFISTQLRGQDLFIGHWSPEV